MVSTEKYYTIDNFPALNTAIVRGEYLYQVRLYEERLSFQSAHSGNMRMRMLLGFIEAKAVVVDALIKTEGNLQYLSVLCSSPASPQLFSKILNSISRRIIIEELERSRAEVFLSTRDQIQYSQASIPFSKTIQSVNESKKILFSLLLEYRALLAEFASTMPFESKTTRSIRTSMDFTIPFIVFEKENSVCAIPEFQVKSFVKNDDGTFSINCHDQWNKRIILSDDILCIKELDITRLGILEKESKGFYSARSPITEGDFLFTLVIPSFLE